MSPQRAASEGRSRADHSRHLELRKARRAGDVAALIAGLEDPVEAPFAAKFLADLGARDAAPAIARLLASQDAYKRGAALEALGRLEHAGAAREVLRLAHSDPVPSVRAWAASTAARVAPLEEARSALRRILEDENWQPRRVAAQALGRCGSADDIAAIRAAMRREAWLRRGTYRAAIRAIRSRATTGSSSVH